MNEPLGRYDITVTLGCDGGYRPNPGRVRGSSQPGGMKPVREHHQGARSRRDINVVTVTTPDR